MVYYESQMILISSIEFRMKFGVVAHDFILFSFESCLHCITCRASMLSTSVGSARVRDKRFIGESSHNHFTVSVSRERRPIDINSELNPYALPMIRQDVSDRSGRRN